MPGFRGVRISKFRHVFGSHQRQVFYDGIRITRNAHDSHYCSVNEKFIAIVTESSGGGSFLVIPISKTGKQELTAPRVCGHQGPILDVKFNPFNENLIASSSDDCTVKLWHIPDEGIVEDNLVEPIRVLQGHYRRVGYIQWHPTVENIIASAGYDYKLIIWNTETGEAISTIDSHTDTIHSLTFNYDGSLLATTCKDKKIRVIDPRSGSVIKESPPVIGTKSSKILFLGDTTRLLVTGCSKSFSRQFTIWRQEDLKEPLCTEIIDSGSGILFPFYDADTKMLYLAGKGDGNIRFYEIVDEKPYYYYLNEFKSSSPQRGLAIMPKWALQIDKCEIMRFYKIHAQGNKCEPISMIVPRKAEMFQEDLYPDTTGYQPSLTVSEWVGGINKPPFLISLKHNYDGPNSSLVKIPRHSQPKKPNSPKLAKKPNSPQLIKKPISPQLAKKSDGTPKAISVIASSPTVKKNVFGQRSENVNEESPKPPTHTIETATIITKNSTTTLAKNFADKRSSSEEVSDRRNSKENITATDGMKTVNSQQLFPHLKRVSSLRLKKEVSPADIEAEIMNMDQLRKAYLRQQDEIRGLKNQISIKNMRIKQLEKELEATKEAAVSTNGTSPLQSQESEA